MRLQASDASKYRILELSDGFVIDAPDRNKVHVEFCRTHFRLCCGDGLQKLSGLIEYRRLLEHIAWGLMQDWEPPKKDRKPWPGIKEWAVSNTRRSLGGRVYQQWCRLLKQADTSIIAVQKSVFSVTLGAASITLNDHFYRDRFLVRDVIRFRAAAIAARHIQTLARIKKRNQILQSPQVSQLHQLVEGMGGSAHVSVDVDEIDETTAMDFLQRWLELFSAGKCYTSLRRTLMNLPGGIASGLLVNLPETQLPRPIHQRLELLVVLLAAEQTNQTNQRVFHFALADRIRVAMSIVSRGFGRQLNHRSTQDVNWFVKKLAEYPEPHGGNIVGLATKVVRSHKDETSCRIETVLRQYGCDTELQSPPINLPDTPEIQFLATPAQLCEEGVRMKHCVEMLIPEAIEGRAFFFHVEKYGCSATVQVDSITGQIYQAKGPFNKSNRACQWATRFLRRWGAAIPRQLPPTQVEVHRLDPDSVQALPF